MALYTILFGISIFMIALVVAVIKKMFFHWKQEHKIERMAITTVERPAVSVMISMVKCVLSRRRRAGGLRVFDSVDKSDLSVGGRGRRPSPPSATSLAHSATQSTLEE